MSVILIRWDSTYLTYTCSLDDSKSQTVHAASKVREEGKGRHQGLLEPRGYWRKARDPKFRVGIQLSANRRLPFA